MSEKELKGTIKTLSEHPEVKCGSYAFVKDANITYADIYLLLNYIRKLQQENKDLKEKKELKKQLDDCKNGYKKHLNNQLSEDIEPDPEDFYLAEIEGKANDYDKLVAQQKEFIKYLEDSIKVAENTIESLNDCRIPYSKCKEIISKEILSKYKKIIGNNLDVIR